MTVQHGKTPTARTRPADPLRVLAGVPQPRAVLPEDAPEPAGHRWQARPVVARLVQLVVLAVPLAASVVVALAVSAALPRSHDFGTALLWWLVVVVASTAAMIAVDRVARRLLPLAVLLRLSLLFPDQAPRRYRLAAQAWSSRRLRERLETARITGETGAPLDAAAQIIGLLASLAIHDRRTRGHCERVRAYNDLLAEELGLSEGDRDRLRWAALIHDIGKLKVSPRLLNKPGTPTRDEWSVLRAHPLRGAEIAAPLNDWLGPWAAAIEQHHERWDGEGYPHGLHGTDISLGARIVAVADAFEVMTSTRPYSRPVDAAAARIELAECAGSHFDPVVVRAFLSISLGRLRKVMGPIAWAAQVPFVAGMPRLEAAIIGGGRQAAVGAGAAGAAAGVVAVTTLAPPVHAHAAGHSHVAVAPAADVAPGRSTGDPTTTPPAGTSAPAPAAAAPGAAGHHPGTARAEQRAARHDHGHGKAHPHANIGRFARMPGNDTSVARRPDGVANGTSATHRNSSGHGNSDNDPGHLTDGVSVDGVDGRPVVGGDSNAPIAETGRCAGNRGVGVGNGGPQGSRRPHGGPSRHRSGDQAGKGSPPEAPPGLAECE